MSADGPKRATGPTGRRALAYAVLLCLAGAGLALYAATRTWNVEVTVRPAPLPELRSAHHGPSWLAPIAVVGLAAAGALIATRGTARRAVGVLLILVGAGLAVGGGQGLADSRLWPALCLIGGVAVALAGGLTVARGQTWPGMGARYERSRTAPSDRPAPAARDGSVASTQAWDALDRGEDPTLR
jgi:Tryptophan-associated transmembrane protein (Trp_oprn_chp)